MIRPAREDDFEAIARICNHYIEHTSIHFGETKVTAEELRREWREKPEHPWWVCEEDVVLGYAKSSPWRTRAAYRWTAETGIYFSSEVIGRGLGRPLYSRLLEDLKTRGFHSVVAGIALPNEPSVKLHRALGFADVGVIQEAGFKFGKWHDVAFFQKKL